MLIRLWRGDWRAGGVARKTIGVICPGYGQAGGRASDRGSDCLPGNAQWDVLARDRGQGWSRRGESGLGALVHATANLEVYQ